MKKLFPAYLLFLLLVACQPETFKPIGDRTSYMKEIPGAYKLTRVIQSDIKAVKNNYPFKTLDLTTKFPYTDFELSMNTATGTAGTFTTKQGNSPTVIRLASGNWSVDNADAPKRIYFVNGTDSVKLEIGNYISLRNKQLTLRLVRTLDGKPVINYDFEFTKK
jgi:hypothetical protein